MYMYGDESTRSPLILVGILLKSKGLRKLLPDTLVADVSQENIDNIKEQVVNLINAMLQNDDYTVYIVWLFL